MMVGTTIASMMPSESMRMVLSAAPIGPIGVRMPEQPERQAAITPRPPKRNAVTHDAMEGSRTADRQ